MLSKAHGWPTWQRPGRYGYADALESAGLIVAPLLAGFTITLVGLLLDTSTEGIAHRDLTLVILVGSVGALLAAMQFAYAARQFAVKPDEIGSWWPGLDDPSDDGVIEQWRELRAEQLAHQTMHDRWGKRFRDAYHLGVMLLLIGLVVVLIPSTPGRTRTVGTNTTQSGTPSSAHNGGAAITTAPRSGSPIATTPTSSPGIAPTRWAAIIATGALAVFEGLWILATELQGAEATADTLDASAGVGGRAAQPGVRLKLARWLMKHRPFGPALRWLSPSYRHELEEARAKITRIDASVPEINSQSS
jgi:hypothetical protein